VCDAGYGYRHRGSITSMQCTEGSWRAKLGSAKHRAVWDWGGHYQQCIKNSGKPSAAAAADGLGSRVVVGDILKWALALVGLLLLVRLLLLACCKRRLQADSGGKYEAIAQEDTDEEDVLPLAAAR
jgi:hypothetical protein